MSKLRVCVYRRREDLKIRRKKKNGYKGGKCATIEIDLRNIGIMSFGEEGEIVEEESWGFM